MKILLIDDDKLVRFTLSRILIGDGHTVLTAENGHEGVAFFRKERPDVVITDIIMPLQEGIETIIQLRHECPEIKIIAISGGMRGRDFDVGGPLPRRPNFLLSVADKLGADEVIAKPFEPQELLAALTRLISARRSAGSEA